MHPYGNNVKGVQLAMGERTTEKRQSNAPNTELQELLGGIIPEVMGSIPTWTSVIFSVVPSPVA